MKTKDAIKRNFSRYAAYYDAHSSIQDRVGLELIGSIETEGIEKILDLGCGTGNYTQLLRNSFPSAAIKAVDISSSMVEVAQRKLRDKRIEFVVADAETMTLTQNFDLITSNVCLQWFDNLQKAVTNYKMVLTADGMIVFSIFGPLTFRELNDSLGQLYEKDIQLGSNAFMDTEKLSEILKNNFSLVSISETIFKEKYASLWDLLSTIKYTGSRGPGLNGSFLGKDRIGKLEKIYKEKFSDITATYQVFYCQAKGKK